MMRDKESKELADRAQSNLLIRLVRVKFQCQVPAQPLW
jgi:hypothetical protein